MLLCRHRDGKWVKGEEVEEPKVKMARTNEPHPEVHANATDYMRTAGHQFDQGPLDYAPLDQGQARSVAHTYDRTPHDPSHPDVAKSYHHFKGETLAQFKHLQSRGVNLEPWKSEGQPYRNSQEMAHDVHHNKHLAFFTGGDMPEDHPLAEQSGLVVNGQPLTYNDAFRAVHDYYGHAAYGNEFGPRGEEHAWRAHQRMYSPEARPAMTQETKGQNSWVNFGPYSDMPVQHRPFAQQKANVLQMARRALGRVRKARVDEDIVRGFANSPMDATDRGVFADHLEEQGHPLSPLFRDQKLTGQALRHHLETTGKRVMYGTEVIPGILEGTHNTGFGNQLGNPRLKSTHDWYRREYGGMVWDAIQRPEAYSHLLHPITSPAAWPDVTKKARIETPEDREHNEAQAALTGGEKPSSAIVGRLRPGTVVADKYRNTMNGPQELTSVPSNSFGHRPQTYRNQGIITKYREQIRRAVLAGKRPAETMEPVEGEPIQREDINSGYPTNYLRDGNHRVDAALAEGLPEVPAWFPMRKARKSLSEWGQMVNEWSNKPADTQTLGILADYLEERGNPNSHHLRSPEALAHGFHNWIWAKYPQGATRVGKNLRGRRAGTYTDETINRQKEGHLATVTQQASKLFSGGINQTPGVGLAKYLHSFEEAPTRKGRLGKLLDRVRTKRSGKPIKKALRHERLEAVSFPHGYQGIEVPEPLTTANSQHWLDYNLQPHEKEQVDRSNTLGEQIERASPMSMTLQSTLAGRHGRHWYDENHDILKAATHHSSDPRDFHRLAGLEAATSPNAGIIPNQHAAYDLFRLWHNGLSTGGHHIPGRSEKPAEIKKLIDAYAQGDKVQYPPDYPVAELRGQPLMRKVPHPRPTAQNKGIQKQIHTQAGWEPAPLFYPIHGGLAHKILSNPAKFGDPNRVGGFTGDQAWKADSFLRNKLGNQDAVTIDRHEARGYGFKENELHPGLYHFLAATGRHVARLLNRPEYNTLATHPIHGQGWTPARGQAARWMTMRGISSLLKKGASSEQAALGLKANDIYNTSSFVQMFHDPRYKNRIKTMMAEGSLPPDFLKRVTAVERQYKPDPEELAQNVGHPDLVPLARRIKGAIIKAQHGRAKALAEHPTLPGF